MHDLAPIHDVLCTTQLEILTREHSRSLALTGKSVGLPPNPKYLLFFLFTNLIAQHVCSKQKPHDRPTKPNIHFPGQLQQYDTVTVLLPRGISFSFHFDMP